MAASLVFRRYDTTLFRWHWRLLSLADGRLSEEEHTRIIRNFGAFRNLVYQFTFQVRKMAGTEESLIGNLVNWKWLFLMSAMTLKLAVVERRHTQAECSSSNAPDDWQVFGSGLPTLHRFLEGSGERWCVNTTKCKAKWLSLCKSMHLWDIACT